MLNPPKQITVKAVRQYVANGKAVKPGTIVTYDRALASELIANGKAEAHNEPVKSAEAKPAKAETAKARD